MMEKELVLKKQLAKHLAGGSAFVSIDKLMEMVPMEHLGTRPDGLPYSFFEVFVHIVKAQNDILKYCQSPSYESMQWPEDYWPAEQQPKNEQEWEKWKEEYLSDRRELERLVLLVGKSLDEGVPSHPKHTFFREIMLVIEHTAYHTGQLVLILRLLGLYPGK